MVIAAMWWLVSTGRIGLPTALTALRRALAAVPADADDWPLLNGLGESVLYLRTCAASPRRPARHGGGARRRVGVAGHSGPRQAPDQFPTAEQVPLPAGEFRTLRAESISFGYPGSTVPRPPGRHGRTRRRGDVALVGANGSGKTTLAKILAGLYRPDSGHLVYGGVPDPEPERLRSASAVVFQDFIRYRLTAADNILFRQTPGAARASDAPPGPPDGPAPRTSSAGCHGATTPY